MMGLLTNEEHSTTSCCSYHTVIIIATSSLAHTKISISSDPKHVISTIEAIILPCHPSTSASRRIRGVSTWTVEAEKIALLHENDLEKGVLQVVESLSKEEKCCKQKNKSGDIDLTLHLPSSFLQWPSHSPKSLPPGKVRAVSFRCNW